MSLEHISEMDRNTFADVLKNNDNSVVVFKFTANWCGPCKKIAPLITERVAAIKETYPNFIYTEVDVDEAFDLYAFLRRKKMVTSIPTMLMYLPGNQDIFPDDSHNGSDEKATSMFFGRVAEHLSKMGQN